MRGFVLRRLSHGLLTLFVGSVLVWGLAEISPGDPARQVLTTRGVASPRPAQVVDVRAELGLDRPAAARYAAWVGDAVRGDFGISWRTGDPVAVDVGARLPATVRLSVVAILLGLCGALPLAIAGALGAGRWPDALSRGVVFGAASLPSFVVGIVVLEVVVVGWGVGRVVADGSWSGAVLPAIPLALGIAAEWARVLRSGLDDALAASYSSVAAARGSSRARIVAVHALPAAAGPLLAVVGVTVGGLLAGAAVVETLFTWPGLGRELVVAIGARDLPVLQAIVAIGVLAFWLTGVLADLAAGAIDPRLRKRVRT